MINIILYSSVFITTIHTINPSSMKCSTWESLFIAIVHCQQCFHFTYANHFSVFSRFDRKHRATVCYRNQYLIQIISPKAHIHPQLNNRFTSNVIAKCEIGISVWLFIKTSLGRLGNRASAIKHMKILHLSKLGI